MARLALLLAALRRSETRAKRATLRAGRERDRADTAVRQAREDVSRAIKDDRDHRASVTALREQLGIMGAAQQRELRALADNMRLRALLREALEHEGAEGFARDFSARCRAAGVEVEQ